MAKRTKKAPTRSGKRKPGRVLVKLLLAGACVTGAVYGLHHGWRRVRVTSFFHCKEIMVRGNGIVPAELVREQLPLDTQKSIFDYDITAMAARLAKHPFIRSCTVSRRLPAKLVVTVHERTPVAYLRSGAMYLVDDDRVLLPLPRSGVVFDLPVITGLSVPKSVVGRRVAMAELETALGFLEDLTGFSPALAEKISEVSIDRAGGLAVRTVQPARTVYFGMDGFAGKMEKWDILEQYDPAMQKNVQYVDLRFADQIIVKKKS